MEHLEPQFLGDTQTLAGAQTADALAPVDLFALADRVPVARDELTDPAGNHAPLYRDEDRPRDATKDSFPHRRS